MSPLQVGPPIQHYAIPKFQPMQGLARSILLEYHSADNAIKLFRGKLETPKFWGKSIEK